MSFPIICVLVWRNINVFNVPSKGLVFEYTHIQFNSTFVTDEKQNPNNVWNMIRKSWRIDQTLICM